MFQYGIERHLQQPQDFCPTLYNARTSDSSFNEEEESESWSLEFEHFQFLKEISISDSSAVWIVNDLRSDQIRVAKIVSKVCHSESQRKHLKDQTEFLAQCSLKHSVKTLQIHETDDFRLFLMEYLPQGDLSAYVTQYSKRTDLKFKKQHIKWVRFCMDEILKGVEELHRAGYVHRDLKPENFMVTECGHLKLNDFGFVIKTESIDPSYCGTPTYMCPQRIDSKKSKNPVLPSVDAWSIGVIMYELLTGHSLFESSSRSQLLDEIYSGVCLRALKQAPQSAKSLILGLLQINPNKRMTIQEARGHSFFDSQE